MSSALFPRFDQIGSAILSTKALSIGYNPSQPIGSDINIELQPGQTMALVGGNGSGKTTFLKTVAGLIEPCAGSVFICGKVPRTATREMAWLGQFHPANPLLPLRVRDLVRMAHFPRYGLVGKISVDDEAITDEALDFTGMKAYVKKTLGELSGGQRQKVFLAYVIARRAPLVLLDEPQQNLDGHGDGLVAEAMRLWNESGASVITATHDRHEALKFDQILHFPPETV